MVNFLKDIQTIRNRHIDLVPAIRIYLDKDARSYALSEGDEITADNVSSFERYLELRNYMLFGTNPLKFRIVLHNARHSLTDLIHSQLSGRPDVIVVGEQHFKPAELLDQAVMIRRHKPEYVLEEVLHDSTPEDTKSFASYHHGKSLDDILGHRHNEGSLFNYTIAHVGAQVAGCEKTRNKSREKEIADAYEHGEDAVINQSREDDMGRTITDYVRTRKTNRPIIAIVGRYHTRNGSGIYPALKESGVRYRIIREMSLFSDPIKASKDLFYSFTGMKQ